VSTISGEGHEEYGKIRKYKTNVYGAIDQFDNEDEFLECITSLPRVPLRYIKDDSPHLQIMI
jgi:hypothetical protein